MIISTSWYILIFHENDISPQRNFQKFSQEVFTTKARFKKIQILIRNTRMLIFLSKIYYNQIFFSKSPLTDNEL